MYTDAGCSFARAVVVVVGVVCPSGPSGFCVDSIGRCSTGCGARALN